MANKKPTFEESIKRLEEIVRLLEGGDVTLDESIKLYTEGAKLVNECNAKLDETEKKIKLLVTKGNSVEETDFN